VTVMRGHIADDQWIDVVDGVAAPEVRAHLAACAACRQTSDEVGAAWTAASDATVPEPSPLYWETFRGARGWPRPPAWSSGSRSS
jgi:predicted anti-sigma-YlaC factor YlaD